MDKEKTYRLGVVIKGNLISKDFRKKLRELEKLSVSKKTTTFTIFKNTKGIYFDIPESNVEKVRKLMDMESSPIKEN